MWGRTWPGRKLHVALNVFSCCNLAHNNNSWQVPRYLYPALARCQAPLKALDLGLLPHLAQEVRQPRLLAVKRGSQNPTRASF